MTFFTSHCLKFIARYLLLLHSDTCHPHFIKGSGWARLGLNVGGSKRAGPNKFLWPMARSSQKINGPGRALNIGPVQGSSLDGDLRPLTNKLQHRLHVQQSSETSCCCITRQSVWELCAKKKKLWTITFRPKSSIANYTYLQKYFH